jgi:hypothetical protein
VLPFAFVPFGGGVRVCPGNEFARVEMLVSVHYIMRRFRWKLAAGSDRSFTNLQIPAALPISGPAHRHRAHSEMNDKLHPISTGEIRGSKSSKHHEKVHSSASVVVVVQLDCSTYNITCYEFLE